MDGLLRLRRTYPTALERRYYASMIAEHFSAQHGVASMKNEIHQDTAHPPARVNSWPFDRRSAHEL
jgi:hypothetical protein